MKVRMTEGKVMGKREEAVAEDGEEEKVAEMEKTIEEKKRKDKEKEKMVSDEETTELVEIQQAKVMMEEEEEEMVAGMEGGWSTLHKVTVVGRRVEVDRKEVQGAKVEVITEVKEPAKMRKMAEM